MEYGNYFDFSSELPYASTTEHQWIRYIFWDHDRLSVGDRACRDDWHL